MYHLSIPLNQAFTNGHSDAGVDPRKAVCADLLLGVGETLGLDQQHQDVQNVQQALEIMKHYQKIMNNIWLSETKLKEAPCYRQRDWGWGLNDF